MPPIGRASSEVDWTDLKRSALEKSLKRHLEGEVRFDLATRVLYSTDASHYQIEPVGVVIPKTRDDVIAAVSIAMEQQVPIVPRGGGTSLSGQSIGPGIVIDFRKYLNRILETNFSEQWVQVEPGVVLAQLNRHLEPMGYQFGPDVATADRANLGGMIGNNSAGARSIKFGKTVDHVLSLDVVLTDGSLTTLGPVTGDALQTLVRRDDREGRIYNAVSREINQNEEEIRRRFPKLLRRVSGYNLDALLPPNPTNLAKLIVGSEGSLATVTGARLRIVPRPKYRGLAIIHYENIEAALSSLAPILDTHPAAVELIDQMILELARANVIYASRLSFVQGHPGALFIVEYSAMQPGDVELGFELLKRSLADYPAGPIVTSTDAEFCDRVWNVRKIALPLLMSLPGGRKPVTFVEDTAVDPSRLPEFVCRFREIMRRHGTDGSFYGHASVGCLHIRPLLDLRTAEGIRDMTAIADDVVDLVIEFEGALSGEHGDGLCRGMFNRKLFGDQVYEAFRAIKYAFDPDNLMNPGKIVEAPLMTDHLRVETYHPVELPTLYSFEADNGIAEVADRCNGNGLCRREGVGVMCPSYMATREEEHSPRGRANLLRATFEGRLNRDPQQGWMLPALDQALDLCLSCKACKTECPSAVDVAKMKSEYLYQSYRRRQPPFFARMLADMQKAARLGSQFAPFSSWLIRSWPARWLLDRFVGIDMRRRLPAFRHGTLVRWFSKHRSVARRIRGQVVLLADCFTNYHEPRIGRSAVQLLELAGYQVHLANVCCGRPAISKGMLDEAKALAVAGSQRLFPFAQDGVPILGMEPSCILTLADEWRDLAPGEESASVAGQVDFVENWLMMKAAADLPAPPLDSADILVHGHCHQKSAGALAASVNALRMLARAKPNVLDAGCCGMAGSFGYEKSHYDLSVAIFTQRLAGLLRQDPDLPVIAPGFSCRTQIADLTGRVALHPIDYIQQRVFPDADRRFGKRFARSRESIEGPA